MGVRSRPTLARDVPAIPASDVDALRPAWIRTTVIRLALGVLLLALAAAAVVVARALQPAKAAFVPRGTSGVVVLDVSLSVTDPVYKRIHNTLQLLARSGDAVGVVVFSDVAYEMLPPGSPPQSLEPMLRFYRPGRGRPDPLGVGASYPVNPWSGGFSAGTKISAGLELAQDALAREGIENGSIVLVSDLDTAPSDQPQLSLVLADLKSAGIPIRVVPLFALDEDKAFFAQILGEDALITPPQLVAANSRRAQTSLLGANPSLLALIAGAVLFLLAANEWWGARVELPGRPS